jgi:hypothetical protein
MSSKINAGFSPRNKSTSTVQSLTSSPVCTPASFNAPTNQTPCSPVCGSGSIGAQVTFGMSATFSSTAPASCELCVYRQLVQGYFAGTKPSGVIDYFDKELAPGVYLSMTEFQEDGGLIGGSWARYGHREDPTGIWTIVGDSYTPAPRTTGCTYSGSDAPQTCLSASTYQYYDMYLSFQGQICQVPCDPPQEDPPGNNTVSVSNWTVHCTNHP